MRTGRPRTPIGTHGAIDTRREGRRVVAETRVRDFDGLLRQVRATGPTAASARTRLLERNRERPALPSAGVLRPPSSFGDLARRTQAAQVAANQCYHKHGIWLI